MWCTARPSRCHLRPVTDDVASAPPVSRTTCPTAPPSSPAPGSEQSATATGQPPTGTWPATAISPPRLTRIPPRPQARYAAAAARSDPRPFAVAPRSRRTPAGRPSVVPSSVTDRQPGAAPGAAPGGPPARAPPMAAKSRSYPRAMSAPPTVGSTRPPVHRAAVSATPIASARPRLSWCTGPGSRSSRDSSESSRNRLACRSSRSSSASTAASADRRPSGGQTATRALVPSAARSATATAAPPAPRLTGIQPARTGIRNHLVPAPVRC